MGVSLAMEFRIVYHLACVKRARHGPVNWLSRSTSAWMRDQI